MAKLVYTAITSLDGFVEDASGSFDWAAPDEEVHAFVNDLERPIGTHLYGRRMYETMLYWETALDMAGQPPFAKDYARIWQAADKVVYSTTLDAPSTGKTRVVRAFDPEDIREMKASASGDMSVGGSHLAAQALRAGLVDEVHLILNPIVVGSGKPSLPPDVRQELDLIELRRFGNGTVHLHYGMRSS